MTHSNSPIQTREQFEQKEARLLAPYAALSSKSRGRVYQQSPHPLRTAYQRDRDRIVHSAAFRRMEYKTQVFIPHESDHFRTRLTHTIEVAQISRTLSRSLGLNEDLAEAIALVHDLGHTPFGHAGEDVLDELLKDLGGFNHNRQSLRVVDILERRYESHPGLNLSYEVREGIVKHETKVKIALPDFNTNERPTLEAALVDIADEIAYNAHDIDDGLSSGLISFEELMASSFMETLAEGLTAASSDTDKLRYLLVRKIIDKTVRDVLEETSNRIISNKIKSIEDVRAAKEKLCGYSGEMKTIVKEIKAFLFQKLYRHPEMARHSEHAEKIIAKLFNSFNKDTSYLPDSYQARLKTDQQEFVVADYIAGMTDRFAEKIYESL